MVENPVKSFVLFSASYQSDKEVPGRNLISQSSGISLDVQAASKKMDEEISCMPASSDSFLSEATAVTTSLGISSTQKRKHFLTSQKTKSPETLFEDVFMLQWTASVHHVQSCLPNIRVGVWTY